MPAATAVAVARSRPGDLLRDRLREAGRAGLGAGVPGPEYRPLATRETKKRLPFELAVAPCPTDERTVRALESAWRAQRALDEWLHAADATLAEGRTSWERYLALPRASVTEKRTAEVYRILRVVRIALAHANGRVDCGDGLVRLACTFGRCALGLQLSVAGLELLAGFVGYLLAFAELPYSEAYGARMLAQYYTDIAAEVHRFADEDRVLFQFQPLPYFNRHCRFDCDHPDMHSNGGFLEFDFGARFADAGRYAIDAYAVIDERVHIVPVEALAGGRIAEPELVAWRARCPDGAGLPATFRARFVREQASTLHPMT